VINHREGEEKCAHSRMPAREGKGAWSANWPNPLNKMNFFQKRFDGFPVRLYYSSHLSGTA
jgi:hypothetical protein